MGHRTLRLIEGTNGDGEPTTERTVRLSFGPFGWDAIVAAAPDGPEAVDAFVQGACTEYHRQLFGAALSLEPPQLPRSTRSYRDFTISASPEEWEDLRLEAGRHGIDLGTLLEHAVVLRLSVR